MSKLFPREFFATLGSLRGRLSGSGQGHNSIAKLGRSRRGFEHRAYAPGDNPRDLDWKAFARTRTRVLRIPELDEGGVLQLVLDRSASMIAPSLDRDFAQRRLALALAFLQLDAGGDVQIATLGNEPAAKLGKDACQLLLESMPGCGGESAAWHLKPAQRTVLITDPWVAIPTALPAGVEVVVLVDPSEDIVSGGAYSLTDSETGATLGVALSTSEYQLAWRKHLDALSAKITQLGGKFFELRSWGTMNEASKVLEAARKESIV